MSKIDKFEQARRDGMAYAYKIAEERGIDGLRQELEYRNIYKHPIGLEMEYLHAWLDNVKRCVVASMKVCTVLVLHDKFGFGKARLDRYLNSFNDEADAILSGYAEFEDFRQTVLEEVGIDIVLDKNDTDVKINKRPIAGI